MTALTSGREATCESIFETAALTAGSVTVPDLTARTIWSELPDAAGKSFWSRLRA